MPGFIVIYEKLCKSKACIRRSEKYFVKGINGKLVLKLVDVRNENAFVKLLERVGKSLARAT